MLRSVMTDALLDRHSEEASFDPWFATFAHPTNTYGNGAAPERIDYLMYRPSPRVKMRTYDFWLPLVMGKDAAGRPMSVSDHEGLHAEFIVEKRVNEGTDLKAIYDNKSFTPKRTYYPMDRSGLSYAELQSLDENVPVPFSDGSNYKRNNSTPETQVFHKQMTKYVASVGPTHVEATELNHNGIEDISNSLSSASNSSAVSSDNMPNSSETTVVSSSNPIIHSDISHEILDRIGRKREKVKSTQKTATNEIFDRYKQVLFLLNLTVNTSTEDVDTNKLSPLKDENQDPY